MTESPFFQANDLSWKHSSSKRAELALEKCSVDVIKGKWTALVAPNGAGKSTLLQVLAGVHGFSSQLVSGSISWNGLDWVKLSSLERARRVAYLGAELGSLFPVTVEQAVSSSVFTSGRSELVDRALDFADLISARSRLLTHLSGGERQRVGIARALVQGAEVLFLDESLSKMDPDYQQSFGQKLKRLIQSSTKRDFQVHSIVSVSHDLHFSRRWADRAWVMARGKMLAQGAIQEVLSDSLLRAIYPNVAPEFLIQK